MDDEKLGTEEPDTIKMLAEAQKFAEKMQRTWDAEAAERAGIVGGLDAWVAANERRPEPTGPAVLNPAFVNIHATSEDLLRQILAVLTEIRDGQKGPEYPRIE